VAPLPSSSFLPLSRPTYCHNIIVIHLRSQGLARHSHLTRRECHHLRSEALATSLLSYDVIVVHCGTCAVFSFTRMFLQRGFLQIMLDDNISTLLLLGNRSLERLYPSLVNYRHGHTSLCCIRLVIPRK
jgi:hypothetical protein